MYLFSLNCVSIRELLGTISPSIPQDASLKGGLAAMLLQGGGSLWYQAACFEEEPRLSYMKHGAGSCVRSHSVLSGVSRSVRTCATPAQHPAVAAWCLVAALLQPGLVLWSRSSPWYVPSSIQSVSSPTMWLVCVRTSGCPQFPLKTFQFVSSVGSEPWGCINTTWFEWNLC